MQTQLFCLQSGQTGRWSANIFFLFVDKLKKIIATRIEYTYKERGVEELRLTFSLIVVLSCTSTRITK